MPQHALNFSVLEPLHNFWPDNGLTPQAASPALAYSQVVDKLKASLGDGNHYEVREHQSIVLHILYSCTIALNRIHSSRIGYSLQ